MGYANINGNNIRMQPTNISWPQIQVEMSATRLPLLGVAKQMPILLFLRLREDRLGNVGSKYAHA